MQLRKSNKFIPVFVFCILIRGIGAQADETNEGTEPALSETTATLSGVFSTELTYDFDTTTIDQTFQESTSHIVLISQSAETSSTILQDHTSESSTSTLPSTSTTHSSEDQSPVSSESLVSISATTTSSATIITTINTEDAPTERLQSTSTRYPTYTSPQLEMTTILPTEIMVQAEVETNEQHSTEHQSISSFISTTASNIVTNEYNLTFNSTGMPSTTASPIPSADATTVTTETASPTSPPSSMISSSTSPPPSTVISTDSTLLDPSTSPQPFSTQDSQSSVHMGQGTLSSSEGEFAVNDSTSATLKTSFLFTLLATTQSTIIQEMANRSLSPTVLSPTTDYYQPTHIEESEQPTNDTITPAAISESTMQTEKEILIEKKWTDTEVFIMLSAMFVLNLLVLVVAGICVVRHISRKYNWERPPSRYGSKVHFRNSRPQLEGIRAINGQDLASDAECKLGEKSPKICIISKEAAHGWCVPFKDLQKSGQKLQTQEDTGV